MSKRTFLVTGALGFIGSWLCEDLLARGHTVIGLDDLSTGSLKNRHPDLLFTKHDCRYSYHTLCPDQTFSGIFHFADQPGADRSAAAPFKALTTPIITAKIAAYTAKRWNVPLVYASSSEVYGRATHLSERSVCYHYTPQVYSGRQAYALGKLAGEAIIATAGVQYAAARLFNIIGRRQREGFAIPNFFTQIKAGGVPLVYKPGLQARTFMDVRDCCESLVYLMFRLLAMAESIGPINVGSDCVYAVLDVARRCSEIAGTAPPDLVESPTSRTFDPDCRQPDLGYLEDLNCTPASQYTLDETLVWIWQSYNKEW